MIQKIAIVGAGLSGLVTAKTLLEYGYEVTVYEKEKEIGGVWASSRRYPGVTTQNNRDTYAFSDFPMPKHYLEWPTGEQIQEYLQNYAHHFQVDKHIQLGATVINATQLDDARWQLEIRQGGKIFTEEADYLVVCNGTFCEPSIPISPGQADFIENGGRILHTSQCNSYESLRDKKVVVVGYGKSSCDVAAGVADVTEATHLIFRESKWKVPKYIAGVNMKYLILSRFGEALTKPGRHNSGDRVVHKLGLPNRIFRIMEGIFTRQQKLKDCKLIPKGGIPDYLFGELSVETDGFFEKVRTGKIQTHRGEIHSFTETGVVLSDGTSLEADAVIYGTGFTQNIPFFSTELVEHITDERSNYLLYRNILPINVLNLAFNGYNTSFFCNMTSEMAALWLAEYLRGNIEIPDEPQLFAEIRHHLLWRSKYRTNALYRGASVYPYNLTYVEQLLKDMKASLPWHRTLYQWLVVAEPSHYAPVKQQIMKRGKKITQQSTKIKSTQQV